MTQLAVLLDTALYHKWNVKTDFTFALQFFMLISDGLGGVSTDLLYFFPIWTKTLEVFGLAFSFLFLFLRVALSKRTHKCLV